MKTTFSVLEVFEINEVDSIFDLQFLLEIEWFNKNLIFEFLKHQNYLNAKTRKNIWIPDIGFNHVYKVINKGKSDVVVLRRGKPTLDADIDHIQSNEVYTGEENPLKLTLEKRIQFSCSFENIHNFPFGVQKCWVKLEVVGAANNLTTLVPLAVINKGPRVVGQYVIDSWTFNNDNKFSIDHPPSNHQSWIAIQL